MNTPQHTIAQALAGSEFAALKLSVATDGRPLLGGRTPR